MRPEDRAELLRKVAEVRQDEEFMARVRRIVAEDRELLDRLAELDGD